MSRPPRAAAADYNYSQLRPAYRGYPGASPGYAHGFPGVHAAPQPYYGAPPGGPYAAAQGHAHLIPGSPQSAYAAASVLLGYHQGSFAAAPGPGYHQGYFAAAAYVPGLQQGSFAASPGCFPPDPDLGQRTQTAPGHFASDWQENVGGHHTSLSSQPGELALLCCSNACTHPQQDELMSDSKIKKVWRHNCGETFTEIKELIARQNLVCIAVDLEFLAHRTTDTAYRPYCPWTWYNHLQQFVNNGDVVQIGLVFACSDPSIGDFLTVHAYEINMIVDVESLEYSQGSVDFLKKQRHDLQKHKSLGVLPHWVSAGLLRHLPFGDNEIIWLAFHGDKDIAFLLRFIQGGDKGIQLPTRLSEFNRQFTHTFPVYYDVKVLGQLEKEGFQGKLKDLAGDEFLGLTKSKAEHHAGSDALLTIRCFMAILRRSSKNNRRVFARKGLLSGAEDLTLCIRCLRSVTGADIQVVEVHRSNFEQEMLHFSKAVENNFNIVIFQVLIPEVASAQDPDYMKIEQIQSFDVLISFMNAEGNLAMGRVWKFFLQVHAYGDETRVEALQFAALLASSRATHDDNTVWVTHRGAYGIGCLMWSFVAPGELPSTWVRYISSRSACFPSIYDIQVMADLSPEHETARNERSVAELAASLKIRVDSCDVVTICRCFNALRDVVNLEEIGTGRLATAA